MGGVEFSLVRQWILPPGIPGNRSGEPELMIPTSNCRVMSTNPTHSSGALRRLLRTTLYWLALLVPMAACVGSACAFFLWSLDFVTRVRFSYEWLLFLLPLGGLGVGLIYHRYGKPVEAGNNLLMDEIHEPGGGVPRRMAPLILFGTLVTHLFGGSAGREGTAVQMGGSIAGAFCRWLRLDSSKVRVLLTAGIAAGFGGVFGTPWAGALFAVEVLTIGRVEFRSLLPCLIASMVGDGACRMWGIGHTHYHVSITHDLLSWSLWGKVCLAALAFGLVSRSFAGLSHGLSAGCKRWISYAPLRPFVGGFLVIGLFFAAGTSDYLGLGVSSVDPNAVTLSSLFVTPCDPWSWLWKMTFTLVTLSCGFKGGEVTPLFFIGAALGNALAGMMGAPVDLFAAMGFLAVFAGATNTPFASALMGMELFGPTNGLLFLVACLIAQGASGRSGIYLSQRIVLPATDRDSGKSVPLRHARKQDTQPDRKRDC